MNKAFVKDPEPGEPRCPPPAGCAGIGVPVTRATLLAQLPGDVARRFADSACYCPSPSCEVAYFDAWGTVASRDALRRQAYPKSPAAPVCACFGITAGEIREAAEAGDKERVREMLSRAEGPDARCATESPSGGSCAVEVRRIFMEHFAPK